MEIWVCEDCANAIDYGEALLDLTWISVDMAPSRTGACGLCERDGELFGAECWVSY